MSYNNLPQWSIAYTTLSEKDDADKQQNLFTGFFREKVASCSL